jgi:aromatic-L-amino-acid/L-tryptophan decarboxylase
MEKWGDVREMGAEALDWVARYYDSLRERPLVRPSTSAELRECLTGPLPQEGSGFDDLVRTLDEVIAGFSRHNADPRFFGYVSSPGAPVATIATMIAAAMNINVTCWRSGPAACELELLTVDWIKEMVGYRGGIGLLVSGGSMANLAGLAAARSAKGSGIVYVSGEAHFSLRKAGRLLGMPVRTVPVNERLELDVEALSQFVQEDRAAGRSPVCVVASAGTAGTGAFDPLGKIVALARREDLWLHVDGAYGGFAALAPSARALFAEIGEADSVALDPHKWLYLPVGCGCILYKDPAAARAAFSDNAEYTRVVGLEHDEAFAFWDYGPELSRPFRALPLWMLVKSMGVRAIAEAIEENLACARYFEELVRATDDFEMLAPVGLSIFCFRYCPPDFQGDLDALNERVMVALQRGGSSYVSNARIHGKFALRGCVLNYRTTRRDMELLLEDLREAGRASLQTPLPK